MKPFPRFLPALSLVNRKRKKRIDRIGYGQRIIYIKKPFVHITSPFEIERKKGNKEKKRETPAYRIQTKQDLIEKKHPVT